MSGNKDEGESMSEKLMRFLKLEEKVRKKRAILRIDFKDIALMTSLALALSRTYEILDTFENSEGRVTHIRDFIGYGYVMIQTWYCHRLVVFDNVQKSQEYYHMIRDWLKENEVLSSRPSSKCLKNGGDA